jgi:hydrogenase nickel incorporation protein HypB
MANLLGEDKTLRYPTIFNTADVAIITKMDMADAVDFDLRSAEANIQTVRPGIEIVEVSAKTGGEMNRWIELLQLRHQRSPASPEAMQI